VVGDVAAKGLVLDMVLYCLFIVNRIIVLLAEQRPLRILLEVLGAGLF
jgi:hypothetical protein